MNESLLELLESLKLTNSLQPTAETGIYLRQHKHDWVYTGARLWPVGVWHPVFTCAICGDAICDLHQNVPGAPEWPSWNVVDFHTWPELRNPIPHLKEQA